MGDKFIFKEDETIELSEITDEKRWKVLIVDDDEDIHFITKIALKDFKFENRSLDILDAYSSSEAIKILKEHNDIAIILLDVVMEKDDSGLRVVKTVRDELKNNLVRIILRTGQPGQAPEKEVIVKYDINGYKEKSELSANKLFTLLYTSFRAYRDLVSLKVNKEGLEKIIKYSSSLFEQKSLKSFSSGVLQQLSSLFQSGGNGALFIHYGSACDVDKRFNILASTVKSDENDALENIEDLLLKAIESKQDIIENRRYVGYFDLEEYNIHLVYLDNVNSEHFKSNSNLISLFAKNISVAFQNVYLHNDLLAIQKELIYSLGYLAESRSKETAQHITRVSYGSELLAKLYGLSKEEQEHIKLASPMHDIGKIGIPDDILLKPGRLSDEEFDMMKEHTTIGHSVFCNSNHVILRLASYIALNHHENFDGTGYPNQKRAEEIPLCARIVAIIDVFDALTHDRCYKKAWDTNKSLEFIASNAGKKFDPKLAQLFVDNIDKFLDISKSQE